MIPPRLEGLLAADGVPMRVAAQFAEAGHEVWLVGGSVRDALLGRDRSDAEFDFTTRARPDEIEKLLSGFAAAVVTVGKAFGTIGGMVDGVPIEATTFRSEVYRDDSRKPSVEFSDNLEEDLSRRDFTVNAMALRLLPEPEIIDPHDGLVDLGAAVLRTPLDPDISFGDDPLRMLRLFRFASTLGFAPDPEAIEAAAAMSQRLSIISAERIRDELDRVIMGEHVVAALQGIVDTGLADVFLPELPALAVAQDPIHHHKDVLSHTLAVVSQCPADRITRLAALFHDVGKPHTRDFGPGGVSFHHHEVVGARMTKARLKALRYSKDDVEAVSRLVYLHMRPHTFKMGWTDRAVRRYVRDAGDLLGRLNDLVRSDVTTRNRKKERQIQRRIDELEERIADLRAREEIDAIRPPIDGNRVMEILEVSPGPWVGEAMDFLLEHRLDHGPYSEEEAETLLREWFEANLPGD
ncbi:MAG: CCA tRNA nucleotidyltransferase [Acidimicrobiia bacterium]